MLNFLISIIALKVSRTKSIFKDKDLTSKNFQFLEEIIKLGLKIGNSFGKGL